MSNVTPISAAQRAPEPPIERVSKYFLAPLFAAGFRRVNDDPEQATAMIMIYARGLERFDSETLSRAAEQIIFECKDPWLPLVAAAREICGEIYKNSPRTRRKQALALMLPRPNTPGCALGASWPTDLGPAPGQPGCLMPVEDQREIFRSRLGSLVGRNGQAWRLRDSVRWISKEWKFDITSPACPIEPALLREVGLPTTAAEFAALERQAAIEEAETAERWRLEDEAGKVKLLADKRTTEDRRRETIEHIEKIKAEYPVWKQRLDAVFSEDGAEWPWQEWGEPPPSKLCKVPFEVVWRYALERGTTDKGLGDYLSWRGAHRLTTSEAVA